ncbi:MAG: NADH-quinone oxidoreductase subunit L [Gemmatimonadetes bacterium]|nr:NADH-quinone oxidoreductase subunit L [Gemmatimonadota bacterium]
MTHPLALIVFLPLLGFLINGTFATALGGRRLGHTASALVGCGTPLLAFALTVMMFFRLQGGDYAPITEPLYRWATLGTLTFDIAFHFDRLSAVMTLIVTGVGSVIHIYATGYMHDDKSFGRFFAYLNLFLFFMLLLVLGRSMLVLFVGWEGVGLASYLLIGFWFDDLANAAAGRKAFITNRVGDFGFLLGMFLLWRAFGTLDMDTLNATFLSAATSGQGMLVNASLVGLLLFVGATGKSAQIPLYVWLPDAMAGPTPVSALIHAATMVTAGVYLIARMSGLYMQAPEASQVIAVVGVLTAFVAATIALVQTDIKKVLAYSTVSQLGFMFLALGVGAYGVAIFHVMTHAFFKACLFLGAGSVIHALGGEQDIRKMGGLRTKIPVTFWTFAIATAAIAGIPGLAGFFSKDEILWFAYASEKGGAPWLWALAAATALMTAFYMTRLLWLTFFGASRMDPHVESHVHESPLSMTGVLVVLALLSAGGGYLALPHFLEAQLPLPAVVPARESAEHLLLYVSIGLALAGVTAAVVMYRGAAGPATAAARSLAPVHRLLSGKYFVDELYAAVLVRPLAWFSEHVLLRGADRALLDGSLDGLGRLAQRTAGLLARVQNGSLQRYALFMLVGVAGVILWSWQHV